MSHYSSMFVTLPSSYIHTHTQICTILNKVAKKECGGTLPEELAMRIAQYSERNLRRALLMLEACRVQQFPFTPQQEVRGRRKETLERFVVTLCCMFCNMPFPPRLYRSK